jgi:hypothetical protein
MCIVVHDWPKAVKSSVYSTDSDTLLFYIYALVDHPQRGWFGKKSDNATEPIHKVSAHSERDGDQISFGTTIRFPTADCTNTSLDLYTTLDDKWDDPQDRRNLWAKTDRKETFSCYGLKCSWYTLSGANKAPITTDQSHRFHTIAALVKPHLVWSREKYGLYYPSQRCYHTQELFPIYCINCRAGTAIPDTFISDEAKQMLEHFRILHTDDHDHLHHLATVLADLSLAETMASAYRTQSGGRSSSYNQALEIFKRQVLERYQIATGHSIPDAIAHIAFTPRLKTYDIDPTPLVQNHQLVLV